MSDDGVTVVSLSFFGPNARIIRKRCLQPELNVALLIKTWYFFSALVLFSVLSRQLCNWEGHQVHLPWKTSKRWFANLGCSFRFAVRNSTFDILNKMSGSVMF